jgi:HAD superfamily hydrolase (TIGR01509 family)
MAKPDNECSRPDLIIFDCDGVLVDSEFAHNEVLSRNLDRYGLKMSPQACWQQFAGGTMKGVRDTATKMGAVLPTDWIDEIYREIYDRLHQGIQAVEGIAVVLDQLEKVGIPFCVASNGSEEKMSITLGQTGLLGRFDGAIFSAHTVGIAKPDPGLFLHAAGTFGVAPDQCIVVEDSVTGARAARLAGMPCYGYAAHDDGAELIEEKAIIIRHMAEISGHLGI